jgi:heme exporter protein B
LRKVAWLLWKDAIAETRTFERIGALGLFAASILITLHFSLPPESDVRADAAAGFLWAAVVFASVLEFRRSFEAERRDGTLDGLRAAPLDPVLLFVSKALSSFIVIALLVVVLVPVSSALLVGDLDGTLPAIGVALLGAAGLIAWGTLFSAVASGVRGGDVVLPILLFPLVVPQTIACVRLLALHMTGERLTDPATGYVLLGAFAALSWGTSLLLFEYVLDE